MPKQRMAGYTPLKGRAHDDDATPLTQEAAPQPVAETGPEGTVAPAPAAPAVRDAVPYEQRQRMAGYTPFQGAAPQVVTGGAPAQATAAPAEGTTQSAAVSGEPSAPSVEDGQGTAAGAGVAVVGGAAVAAASSRDQAVDEQPQSAAGSSEGAQAAPAVASAPAPVAGVPYEQRQRMAGYTPFNGGAPVAASSAAAQSPAVEPVSADQQSAGGHAAGAQPDDPQGAGAGAGVAAAGAVAGGAVAAGAAGASAQDSSASDAEQPDAAAQTQAPAAPVGQRMKGYTPLKGRAAGAPAPAAAASAQAAPAAAEQSPQAQAQTSAQPAAAEQTAAAGAEAPAVAAGQQAGAQKAPAQRGAAAKPAAGQKPAGTPATQPKKKAEDAEPMPLGRKVLWGVLGAVVVGLALVLAARGLRTLEPVQDFIAQYDGHTAQPESAPIGIPAWLGWQHFLNMFLMVLIIRTGLQIRSEQRPPANFTPRKDSLFSAKGNTPKKYSMTIWMHQALDGLWVLNGLVFVILLFVTGQWMRIVPTDPYVFHHALSAGLQYLSLDWPSENGWIHYNALQMIAYTLVVFVAAPLAALTGWRMSSWFPAEAKGLNKAFPMEAARKVHFPVMLFFVAFILVHVFLVVFTGFLANLNHMYTSREATDFWGLVVFLVSVAVTAAAWFFLRPQFVAPVAQRFGTVGR